MFLRHSNTTYVYTLFSFGHERRIALIGLADGVVTLILSFVLGKYLGFIGVPLGSILGVLLTSLPMNIAAVRVDTGISARMIASSQLWWQWRALVLAVIAAVASTLGDHGRLLPLIAKSVLAVLVADAVLLPLMLRPPLGPYINPKLESVLARLGLSRAPRTAQGSR
jgi:hypothetical protein